MNESFGLAMEAISIEKFQRMLESKDLLPGQEGAFGRYRYPFCGAKSSWRNHNG